MYLHIALTLDHRLTPKNFSPLVEFFLLSFHWVHFHNPDKVTFGKYGDGTITVTDIALDTSNINYPKLKGNKYKITDETRNKLWIDIEDRTLGSSSKVH